MGFGAKIWGQRLSFGLERMAVGDGLIFYCSRGASRGYWGIGRVTKAIHIDRKPVWPDEVYPLRIGFEPEIGLLDKKVEVDLVKAALRTARLKFLRQAGVIRLAQREFETIQSLIRTARKQKIKPDQG